MRQAVRYFIWLSSFPCGPNLIQHSNYSTSKLLHIEEKLKCWKRWWRLRLWRFTTDWTVQHFIFAAYIHQRVYSSEFIGLLFLRVTPFRSAIDSLTCRGYLR